MGQAKAEKSINLTVEGQTVSLIPVYGGHSAIIEPFGKILVLTGENEEILTAECDLQILSDIRGSIPVFRDRRPELY